MHRDSSLWTVNICLGGEWEGSKTYFIDESNNKVEIEHEVGMVIKKF